MSIFNVIAFLNIFIDPYFLYGISHKYNYFFNSINERVEKVNRIYYGKKESYDSVLLGSSRATYVNQYDFKEHKLFNFAASSMNPFEYEDYLELMKQKGHSLRTIYLQIDFFGSNIKLKEEVKERLRVAFEPLDNPFNRISNLFITNEQLKNIPLININRKNKGDIYYSRDNIKYHEKIDEKDRIFALKYGLKAITSGFIGKNYDFDEEVLRNILNTIKAHNPNAQFVIYTSPIPVIQLAAEINFAKRWEEYKKWLRIHIEIFGGLYQFMGFNEITENFKEHYFDSSHFYPYVGTLITQTLTNEEFQPIKDFGIYLDSSNIENYIAKLESKLKNYDMSEIIEIMNDKNIK
ncbi:hypothetical protein OQH61_08020 [Helicobacter sp. MIT 21-1697]|uniref:hypothetical protein n=1 Tax=Helicobacter sp. MIT 21-1697 TaxID=2993733 RepID=UPI00224B0FED|nr:hypothetical protein [Helicobacter sp. MIT 21-1697]MCX2717679.1 hypothetical protein [Helicobacter sp. MIT 21-1697]